MEFLSREVDDDDQQNLNFGGVTVNLVYHWSSQVIFFKYFCVKCRNVGFWDLQITVRQPVF